MAAKQLRVNIYMYLFYMCYLLKKKELCTECTDLKLFTEHLRFYLRILFFLNILKLSLRIKYGFCHIHVFAL